MSMIKRIIRKIRSLYNLEHRINNQMRILEESVQKIPSVLSYYHRREFMTYQAFNCKESGVTNERYCEHEVVVSMATHGERFYEAYMAIESIMQQSIKPNRLILNVAIDEFMGKPLPPALRLQQERGLEIHYCEDYWSYKKIIPTLRRFPEAIIITVDDDCLYNLDMLENLIHSHKQDSTAIWGNRIHDICFDPITSELKSYMDWNMCIPNTEEASNLHFITSVGGVLYPPHSLYKDVLCDDIFMNVCKTNDDIWCYVMALLNKTPIKKVRTHSERGEDYLSIEEVQFYGLCQTNTCAGAHSCKNDEIIQRLFDMYDIYRILGDKT